MKRTLFYDRETGELLHSHYEVRVIDGGADGEVRLSAPTAVDLDDEMAELVSRGLDINRIARLTTSAAPQSSRSLARSVDIRTGRLRAQRIEIANDLPSGEEA